MKFRQLISAIVAVFMILALTGCSGNGSDSNIRVAVDSVPLTLDPQLANNRAELLAVRNTFEGLMRLDADGKPQVGAASSYSVSKDRLCYTFTLREQLKWSNSEAITADDFVFGLQRAVDSATAAPDAMLLQNISGAKEIMQGKKPATALGVKAKGNQVIITLEQADNGLLWALCSPVAMPCNREFFEATGGRYGMDAKYLLCNGSFKLTKWTERALTLTRNVQYVGQFGAKAAGVTVGFGAQSAERIEGLGSNIYDIAIIDSQDTPEATDNSLQVIEQPSICWSLIYNSNDKFLSMDGVIKALTASTDKGFALPEGFERTNQFVAQGLTSGALRYGKTSPNPFSQSADKSTDSVRSAVKKSSTAPTLTLSYVETDGMQIVASYIAATWQQRFGLTVNLVALNYDSMLSAVNSGDYQIAVYPVTADDGRAISVFNAALIRELSSTVDGIGSISPSADAKNVIAAIRSAEGSAIASGKILPLAASSLCCAYTNKVKSLQFDMQYGHFDLCQTWVK